MSYVAHAESAAWAELGAVVINAADFATHVSLLYFVICLEKFTVDSVIS